MNIKNNVSIKSLDDFGNGIAYIDNKIAFIPNTLPNEVVDISITKETKKYYEAKVINYIKLSDKRIKPICPYYEKCGGCSILHMSYNDAINYKCDKVKNILNKFASITNNIEIIKNDIPLNYRNKIELKIENNLWGYYNSKTHELISIEECRLAKTSINNVIKYKEYIKIYNGSITIRSNYNDEIILSIKTENKYEIDINSLKTKIKLVGLVVNDKLIYGESFFIEKVKDKFFKVNYNSFFQVNLNIATKMINILNKNSDGDNLLDLYCGVGFLGQSLSNKYKKIYGIEINENSILDAIKNSKINNINNTYYLCGNSSKLIDKINDNIDTIIIDPPRNGLVKSMFDDIEKIKSKKIMYISCDPISLSRDLNQLKKHYNINKIYILDMFSNTYHIETICILKRKY